MRLEVPDSLTAAREPGLDFRDDGFLAFESAWASVLVAPRARPCSERIRPARKTVTILIQVEVRDRTRATGCEASTRPCVC